MSINNLPPPEFLAKMKTLLGNEYEAFLHSYEQHPYTGLRVNTLKISVADFTSKSSFVLKPVGNYAPAGFMVVDESQPGRHPYHAAGLYYLQEPSAMAVAGLLAPQPGELVLDLAAAPGGKATHLASLIGDEGLLVANDIDGRRARILAENLERWGTRSTLVTSAHPEQLARQLGPIFDRVLLDAPCSGEGMFRRIGEFAWNQGMVVACARRQTAILDTAARLVKPGGRLAYTTCTFSPEENEVVVAEFLANHSQFSLVEPPHFPGFSSGRPDWVSPDLRQDDLIKTVRLWPHTFAGEGHFIALMEHKGPQKPEGFNKPFGLKPIERSTIKAWHEFAEENLRVELPEGRMLLKNGRLYLLPEQAIEASGLKIVRYGLLLGELRKGHFKPDHALALALRPDEVGTAVDLPADSNEAAAYLAGHPLPIAADQIPVTTTWALVTVAGFSTGWGKISRGQLKNHYPRRLRFTYSPSG